MATGRYEYTYTTPDTGAVTTFVLAGIEEDVAAGIQFGLRNVPSISDLAVAQVMEVREEVVVTGDPNDFSNSMTGGGTPPELELS